MIHAWSVYNSLDSAYRLQDIQACEIKVVMEDNWHDIWMGS